MMYWVLRLLGMYTADTRYTLDGRLWMGQHVSMLSVWVVFMHNDVWISPLYLTLHVYLLLLWSSKSVNHHFDYVVSIHHVQLAPPNAATFCVELMSTCQSWIVFLCSVHSHQM